MLLTSLTSLRIRMAALALLALSAFWIPGARAQDSSAAPDTLRETYNDWIVECGAVEGGGRFCRMAQQLTQSGAKKPVLSVFIRAKPDDSGALMTLIGPLGISLAGGITVAVGENRLVEADFLTCRPIGCMARKELGAEAIAAFRAGNEAIVTMASMNGDAIAIGVSLSGFSAAWTRLQAL